MHTDVLSAILCTHSMGEVSVNDSTHNRDAHWFWLSRLCSFLILQQQTSKHLNCLQSSSSLAKCSNNSQYTWHLFNGLCPGLPGWASTRKVRPIWISLKQETVSGSGISWAIRKSALHSRQIATPAPHHSAYMKLNKQPVLPWGSSTSVH